MSSSIIKKPNAWIKLRDLLSRLKSYDDLSDIFCESFFVRSRQLLEITNQGSKFPVLLIYCHWMVHDKLSNKNNLLLVRNFANTIAGSQRALFSPISCLDNLLSIPALSEEIRRFLEWFGLSTEIVDVYDYLYKLRIELFNLIVNRQIDCRDRIVRKDGSFNLAEAKSIGLFFSDESVPGFSFCFTGIEIIEKDAGVPLQFFFLNFSVHFIETGKSHTFSGPLSVGRCLNCGSSKTFLSDIEVRCLSCNTYVDCYKLNLIEL